MGIKHHLVQGSQPLDLSIQRLDCVHAIIGKGKGGRLIIPAGWISVTLVLRGSLELGNGDLPWQLQARQLQLWVDGSLRQTSREQAWWLCIAAPSALWQKQPKSTASIFNCLIPRETTCDNGLARAVVHLCRPRWFKPNSAVNDATYKLGLLRDALIERQQPMQTQLERCSGRTILRRHQTLLRLLRVQHLIRCTIETRLDLISLAAVANYSPTHLIRIYREVFGETPSEYAARLRNKRALDMVCNTDLSVCEIAESLGFESESAFCRAFKHAFGCTTTAARRGQQVEASALIAPNLQPPRNTVVAPPMQQWAVAS
ncbi:AraC family transcriptional regulator [uncultured Stenotrophomonas sp.]|uniref:helix-turn-helix domain-containing protein n=1 Tax=uncultured Stenotrophomonas sp. TaxID=165438 RepID=UPI0025DAFF3D|nr:AraC family transcriptional regulator [uncultured Stenotrophomonas sp.]